MSETSPAESRFDLVADDGVRLGACLVGDARTAIRIVVVAGAMGVPSRFYAAFARHLASRGSLVLLFDYRGIGASAPTHLRGFRAGAGDWARLDLDAALALARTRWPELPLAVVGHSFGAQVVGLAAHAGEVDALLLVAAQSGHWRHWPQPAQAGMWAFWHLLIPLAAPLLGHLPGRLLGGGEAVPAGVALEWARWGRHRGYLFDPAIGYDLSGYRRLAVPLLCLGFSDDGFAPRAATRALLDQYPNARVEYRYLAPADTGLERIGHFGFFRPSALTLWQQSADWLARYARN